MRTKEGIAADAKPFSDSVIEKLGTSYDADYVRWSHYNQRLLYAHGGHSYIVTSVTYAGDTWAVSVQLKLGEDEQYGGVGHADNPLAAESNAYKRACAHAGIGLHLYGDFWLYKQLMSDLVIEKDEPSPLAHEEEAEELLAEVVYKEDDPGRPFSQDIAGDAARKVVNTLTAETEML